MKLTKQQKLLSGVMVVAVSALGFDQFVLGTQLSGPTEAFASTEPQEPVVAIMTPSPRPQSKRTDTRYLVTEALRSKADNHHVDMDLTQIRDAFNPSPSWGLTHNSAASIPTETHNPAGLFASNHVLAALMQVDGKSYAVIDDTHILHIGDELDGFTMVFLGPRSAVFDSQGTRVSLPLRSDS